MLVETTESAKSPAPSIIVTTAHGKHRKVDNVAWNGVSLAPPSEEACAGLQIRDCGKKPAAKGERRGHGKAHHEGDDDEEGGGIANWVETDTSASVLSPSSSLSSASTALPPALTAGRCATKNPLGDRSVFAPTRRAVATPRTVGALKALGTVDDGVSPASCNTLVEGWFDCEAEIDSLRSKQRGMEAEIEQKNQLKAAKKENASLRAEHEELAAMVHALEGKVHELEDSVHTREGTIQELEEKLSAADSARSAADKACKAAEKTSDCLRAANEDLEELTEKLEGENRELKTKLLSTDKVHRALQQSMKDSEKNAVALEANLREKIQALVRTSKHAEKERNLAVQVRDQAIQERNQAIQERDRIVLDFQECQAQLATSRDETSRLRREIDELVQDYFRNVNAMNIGFVGRVKHTLERAGDESDEQGTGGDN